MVQINLDSNDTNTWPSELNNLTVYLGSTSYWRKSLISKMGIQPVCIAADIDEEAVGCRSSMNGEALVCLVGTAKADHLLSHELAEIEDGVLITGDQVVTIQGRICEKPKTAAEAKQFISNYSQHGCQTVGSVILTDLRTRRKVTGVEITKIDFSPMSTADIDAILQSNDSVMYCSGALMLEDEIINKHITKIHGNCDSVLAISRTLIRSLLLELYK